MISAATSGFFRGSMSMAFSGQTIASYRSLAKSLVASLCRLKTALALELNSKPTSGVLPWTASNRTEPLPCGLLGSKRVAIKRVAITAKLLAFNFVAIIAIRTVKAESATTPPIETIGNAGDSTWLNAIRVQPKPPKGKRARSSSMRRSVSPLNQRFLVRL